MFSRGQVIKYHDGQFGLIQQILLHEILPQKRRVFFLVNKMLNTGTRSHTTGHPILQLTCPLQHEFVGLTATNPLENYVIPYDVSGRWWKLAADPMQAKGFIFVDWNITFM